MKMDDRSMYPLAMKSLGYPADKDPSTLSACVSYDEFQRFLDRMTELKKTGKPGAWCNRVMCSRCRHENLDAPFESRFENSFKTVCRKCGIAGEFVDSIERWWSLSVWWRPSTWGVGYWESKN